MFLVVHPNLSVDITLSKEHSLCVCVVLMLMQRCLKSSVVLYVSSLFSWLSALIKFAINIRSTFLTIWQNAHFMIIHHLPIPGSIARSPLWRWLLTERTSDTGSRTTCAAQHLPRTLQKPVAARWWRFCQWFTCSPSRSLAKNISRYRQTIAVT